MRPKKIDGHDQAIVGLAWIAGVPALVYDEDLLRDSVMSQQRLSHDDAQEHIDFNIVGSMGSPLEGWPILMTRAAAADIEVMEFEDD